MYVPIDDHRQDDGLIDWAAYGAAKVAIGQDCRDCGLPIWPPSGHPSRCAECKGMDGGGEARHSLHIRCPSCGHTAGVEDDDYDLYEEGEHSVTCIRCDADFCVSTRISYEFTSPPRLEEVTP